MPSKQGQELINLRFAQPFDSPSRTGYNFSHSHRLVTSSQTTCRKFGLHVFSHGEPKNRPFSEIQNSFYIHLHIYKFIEIIEIKK